MKKSAIGFCVLMGALAFHQVQARPLQDIQKSGTIVIGTDGTFPPFQYFEAGTLTGFEIDLGNEIARRMNVKADWKPLPFDTILAGLSQDRFDIAIAAFGVTEVRAKVVDFSKPNFCTGAVIVSTNPAIKSSSDLKDKSVSVQTGSTYFTAAQNIPGITKLRNMSSDNDARNALTSGRTDAWITDKFVARNAQEKGSKIEGKPQTLYLGGMLFEDQSAAAIKKDNKELLEKYNSILISMEEDGTYEAISKKWFNEDVRCKQTNI